MFNNTAFTMPVQPAYVNGGGGGLFGGGDDWLGLIIILALLGFGGNGNFGFGGHGGGYSEVQRGFDQNAVINKLDGLTYGQADSTYAITGAINGLSHQFSDCCCATQRAIDGVNYNMAKGFCDLGNVVNNSTRDILENQNNNTRAILDFMTQDKIATLTAENQALKFQASQTAQNAFITANQEAQTAELIRRLGADCPVNAVVVQPNTPVTFPINSCGVFNGYNGYGNGCGCG